MNPIFEHNGLVSWNSEEIETRRMALAYFVRNIREALLSTNHGWRFSECETPVLMPVGTISTAYNADDYYTVIDGLALRPETTYGSYEVARQMLAQKAKLPLCIYQVGQSFRREQDKSLSNMRLKAFYQLEFQCVYSLNTANDYQSIMLPKLQEIFERLLGACRIVESDRLPAYSLKTVDIERGGMELASISVRTDFSEQARVLEIAIGLDRVVHKHMQTYLPGDPTWMR